MIGKKVLVVAASLKSLRRLETCLRAAGNEVTLTCDPKAACSLVQAGAVDLALFHCSMVLQHGQLRRLGRGQVPIALFGADDDPALLATLVCERGFDHLVAGRDEAPVPARDLTVLAEKILQKNHFGLQKYFSHFATDFTAVELKSADQRDELIDSIADLALSLGARRRVITAVKDIADELITNAIYDAPVDDVGKPKYSSVDRRTKVQLEEEESAMLTFGSDGYTLAISVTDCFGALSPDRVRASLERCLTTREQIESKAGGAGMGIYAVLSACDQLVINLEKGERTEIIALIHLDEGAGRAHKSFHIFSEGFDDQEAASVQLSETMCQSLRNELCETQRHLSFVPLSVKKSGCTYTTRYVQA